MADGQDSPRSQPSHLRTMLWLALFVAAAFALRSAFNVNEGFDAASGRNLFTGNDPYYHWRTVTHVVQTGTNLNFDPAINYPEGNWNPNPPLWTWTTAPLAVAYEHLHVADPVGTALNTMVAFWGALTIIPIFMIASDLWGRKAGLWAGFFMGISAPHIQRSIWGYADHDAISLFFILLGVALLMRGFRQMQTAIYISKWGSAGAVGTGIASAVRANRNTLVYAALAGISITACAVTWKGYPYALAILAVAAFFQMLLDHLRNRDATVTWLAYLITTGIAALLPWALYYNAIPQHFATTVLPSLYVLGGVFAVGLFLVPTRNLPSILVFPGLLVGAIVGYLGLTLYRPEVAHVIFSGLGYFTQTKLYTTIAEAQRPSIGDVAAAWGFFTFLAAFWGLAHVLRRAYKGQPQFVLMAAWASVSVFLMFAASRFIPNAAPVFCVLMGYVMVRVIAFARPADIRKRFRSGHGQGLVSRSFKSLSFRPVAILLLVFLLFILPNAWLGVDAGMGSDFEQDHGLLKGHSDTCTQGACGIHFGGFGIQQELSVNGPQHGWLEAMQYLAKQDANVVPLEAKPAFIGWWDYGHWATNIGMHPTVADPFQSHYELSGRFLASDSEAEAMDWLSILLLVGDSQGNQGHYTPAVQKLLDDKYPALKAINTGYWYDPEIKILRGNVTDANAFALYEDLATATNKRVGYFGVDDRMGPFATVHDVSRQSGIIYAPIFLANKNPDDYVKTQLTAGSQTFTLKQYGPDPQGGFQRLGAGGERYFDSNTNQEYVSFQGKMYLPGHTPTQDPSATGVQLDGNEYFQPTDAYASTMFARGFGGVAASESSAGNGLSHWRVIYQSISGSICIKADQTGCLASSPARRTALLQYYHGVQVSGTVLDDAKPAAPMAGVTVAFVDGNGAFHGQATTDANGTFEVTAPFSQDNDLKLAVLGAVDPSTGQRPLLVADNVTNLQFPPSVAIPSGAAPVTGIVLTVKRGTVQGRIYIENDVVGSKDSVHFNANNDTVLQDATVSTSPGGGQKAVTTQSDASGNYTLGPLQAGDYTASASLAGYNTNTASVSIKAGAKATADIALTVKLSNVKATFTDYNGTGIPAVPMRIVGPATNSTINTDANGNVTFAPLGAGQYTITVDYATTKDNVAVTYKGHYDLTIVFGGQDQNVIVTRS